MGGHFKSGDFATGKMTKAWDLWHRANGRMRHLPDKLIAPNQFVVVALKNRVKNTSTREWKKGCMTEMMSMIQCLEKFGRDQSMCSEEIKKFDQCYVKFRAEQEAAKASKSKGKMPVGANAKVSSEQLNQYMMTQFPLSPRTRQDYFHPKFDPKTKYQP